MVLEGRAVRRWTLCLLVVTGVLAGASVMLRVTARETAWHDLYSFFALSGEYGIAAYWNGGLLALVSATAFLSGLLAGRGRQRWGWFVVGAVTLFMSLDEATQLHERTADLVTHNPLPTFTWVVVGVPLAILLVAVMVLATRSLEPPVRRRLGLALAVYLLGALVFEALSGYAWRQLRPNAAEAFGTVEEVLEMVACVYAAHVIISSWVPLRVSVRSVVDDRAADREVPAVRSAGPPGRPAGSVMPAPLDADPGRR